MSDFTRAISRSTVDPFPLLLEITHPELSPPIRLTNYGQDIISRENIYLDSHFDITLPDLARNEQGQLHVTFAAFAESLRGVVTSLGNERPRLRIMRISPEAPDVILQEWPGLRILGASGQGNKVSLTAASTVLHESAFPDDKFDSRWPGVQNSG